MLVNTVAIWVFAGVLVVGYFLYFATSYQNPVGRLCKVIGVVIMILTVIATILFAITTVFIPCLWTYWHRFFVTMITAYGAVFTFLLILFLLDAIDRFKWELASQRERKKDDDPIVLLTPIYTNDQLRDADEDEVLPPY